MSVLLYGSVVVALERGKESEQRCRARKRCYMMCARNGARGPGGLDSSLRFVFSVSIVYDVLLYVLEAMNSVRRKRVVSALVLLHWYWLLLHSLQCLKSQSGEQQRRA